MSFWFGALMPLCDTLRHFLIILAVSFSLALLRCLLGG